MSYFQRLVVNTLTFVALTVLMPNTIHVRSIWAAILASFVLSLLNMLVKPILTLFSLPLTLITFGLFSFVINAFMLQLTSTLVGAGFRLSSFWGAVLVAIVMSLVNAIVSEHNLTKYT